MAASPSPSSLVSTFFLAALCGFGAAFAIDALGWPPMGDMPGLWTLPVLLATGAAVSGFLALRAAMDAYGEDMEAGSAAKITASASIGIALGALFGWWTFTPGGGGEPKPNPQVIKDVVTAGGSSNPDFLFQDGTEVLLLADQMVGGTPTRRLFRYEVGGGEEGLHEEEDFAPGNAWAVVDGSLWLAGSHGGKAGVWRCKGGGFELQHETTATVAGLVAGGATAPAFALLDAGGSLDLVPIGAAGLTGGSLTGATAVPQGLVHLGTEQCACACPMAGGKWQLHVFVGSSVTSYDLPDRVTGLRALDAGLCIATGSSAASKQYWRGPAGGAPAEMTGATGFTWVPDSANLLQDASGKYLTLLDGSVSTVPPGTDDPQALRGVTTWLGVVYASGTNASGKADLWTFGTAGFTRLKLADGYITPSAPAVIGGRVAFLAKHKDAAEWHGWRYEPSSASWLGPVKAEDAAGDQAPTHLFPSATASAKELLFSVEHSTKGVEPWRWWL